MYLRLIMTWTTSQYTMLAIILSQPSSKIFGMSSHPFALKENIFLQTLIGYSWKISTKILSHKTMILTILIAIFGFNECYTYANSLALYGFIILPSRMSQSIVFHHNKSRFCIML